MARPKFKKTRLPKQRRTIPLPASDRNSGRELTDAGRYFRCWNCGFVCDVERDDLSDTGNGSNPVAVPEVSTGFTYAEGADATKIVVHRYRLSALDSSGDPVGIQHSFAVSGTGCPLCFTRAWKK
jgi:hypothetical protein